MGVDLEEIARVVAHMRSLGITHLRHGELELSLAEAAPAAFGKGPTAPAWPQGWWMPWPTM